MGVDRDVAGTVVEAESVRLAREQVFDELFEEMASARDRFGIGQFQFAVVLDEHGVAGRFEEQDGGAGVRSAKEIEVMPAHLGSSFEIALTESRTAAAFPAFDERDFVTKSFEDFDRGDADVRFVVTDEGVVPKDDLAAIPVAAVCDRRVPVGSAVSSGRYPPHTIFV